MSDPYYDPDFDDVDEFFGLEESEEMSAEMQQQVLESMQAEAAAAERTETAEMAEFTDELQFRANALGTTEEQELDFAMESAILRSENALRSSERLEQALQERGTISAEQQAAIEREFEMGESRIPVEEERNLFDNFDEEMDDINVDFEDDYGDFLDLLDNEEGAAELGTEEGEITEWSANMAEEGELATQNTELDELADSLLSRLENLGTGEGFQAAEENPFEGFMYEGMSEEESQDILDRALMYIGEPEEEAAGSGLSSLTDMIGNAEADEAAQELGFTEEAATSTQSRISSLSEYIGEEIAAEVEETGARVPLSVALDLPELAGVEAGEAAGEAAATAAGEAAATAAGASTLSVALSAAATTLGILGSMANVGMIGYQLIEGINKIGEQVKKINEYKDNTDLYIDKISEHTSDIADYTQKRYAVSRLLQAHTNQAIRRENAYTSLYMQTMLGNKNPQLMQTIDTSSVDAIRNPELLNQKQGKSDTQYVVDIVDFLDGYRYKKMDKYGSYENIRSSQEYEATHINPLANMLSQGFGAGTLPGTIPLHSRIRHQEQELVYMGDLGGQELATHWVTTEVDTSLRQNAVDNFKKNKLIAEDTGTWDTNVQRTALHNLHSRVKTIETVNEARRNLFTGTKTLHIDPLLGIQKWRLIEQSIGTTNPDMMEHFKNQAENDRFYKKALDAYQQKTRKKTDKNLEADYRATLKIADPFNNFKFPLSGPEYEKGLAAYKATKDPLKAEFEKRRKEIRDKFTRERYRLDTGYTTYQRRAMRDEQLAQIDAEERKRKNVDVGTGIGDKLPFWVMYYNKNRKRLRARDMRAIRLKVKRQQKKKRVYKQVPKHVKLAAKKRVAPPKKPARRKVAAVPHPDTEPEKHDEKTVGNTDIPPTYRHADLKDDFQPTGPPPKNRFTKAKYNPSLALRLARIACQTYAATPDTTPAIYGYDTVEFLGTTRLFSVGTGLALYSQKRDEIVIALRGTRNDMISPFNTVQSVVSALSKVGVDAAGGLHPMVGKLGSAVGGGLDFLGKLQFLHLLQTDVQGAIALASLITADKYATGGILTTLYSLYKSYQNDALGDKPLADIFTDLNTIKVSVGAIYGSQGILSYTNNVYQDVVNFIKKYRTPTTTFLFTGHSLGGASADMLKYRLVYDNIIKNSQRASYTIGANRFVATQSVDAFNAACPNTFRITNTNDIVPHVPPASFGFQHIGSEHNLIYGSKGESKAYRMGFDSRYDATLVQIIQMAIVYGGSGHGCAVYTNLLYSSIGRTTALGISEQNPTSKLDEFDNIEVDKSQTLTKTKGGYKDVDGVLHTPQFFMGNMHFQPVPKEYILGFYLYEADETREGFVVYK